MQPSTVLADNPIVDDVLASSIDPDIRSMFLECLRNTLDTTVHPMPDGTNFIVTGDIPAMWLRDSTTQLTPYLTLMPGSPALQDLVQGVLRRQLQYIVLDPYANAFNSESNGAAHDANDLSDNPWVWEHKYEIDSLAFPLQLAYRFWRMTGHTDHLDATFSQAAHAVVALWRTEQNHERASPYRFVRDNASATETLARDGLGGPVAVTGMTWSGFRPSDDACTYGYNIPANLFAATVLGQLAEIAREVLDDNDLAADAEQLQSEIRAGVERYGTVEHPRWGRIYAYEVDGLGNQLLMDDANMPSLLSLPLLGVCDTDDELYVATRSFVLSDDNPYFSRGTAASGVGSPHTPVDYIWHIGIAVQGLTATSSEEKSAALRLLRETDAGTGMMHEGFHKDDPTRYTRPWFSWANSMFCLLVLDVCGYPPASDRAVATAPDARTARTA